MKKTVLFLVIVIGYFYSYSQKDSVKNFSCDCEILEIKTQNVSGLILTQKYIDSSGLKIFKILSKRRDVKIFKEVDSVYIKTKAVVFLNKKLILKQRIKKKLLSQITEQDIKSIKFLDKKEARKRFGWWRGRYGAIIIEIKEPTNPDE